MSLPPALGILAAVHPSRQAVSWRSSISGNRGWLAIWAAPSWVNMSILAPLQWTLAVIPMLQGWVNFAMDCFYLNSGCLTVNGFQTTPGGGGDDAFVAKLSSSATSIVYLSYLGGSSYDEGYGIAVDASGNAYITGLTESTDFP